MATCNDLPTLLNNARCIESCIPRGSQMSALIYLFCQLADAGIKCTPTSAIITGTNIDWSVADYRFQTLSGNTTFTFSNTTEARTITVVLTNTAGNFAVTWPVGIRWTSGVQPVMVFGVRSDLYTFVMINGIIWGTYVQNLS